MLSSGHDTDFTFMDSHKLWSPPQDPHRIKQAELPEWIGGDTFHPLPFTKELLEVSTSLAIMLSDLETALESMVEVYHKYSQMKGNNHALYKDDMKKLLTTECPHYVQNKNTETVFKELDINQDNAINFEEYLVLMIKMGVAAHRDSHKE
ncbi:hypothetical protein STEG23_029911 [Scotinomys teguina]